jgi:predicted transcriptional regulator
MSDPVTVKISSSGGCFSGKTIKQIADELGVSKTAVRKKITPEVKTKFAETIGNQVFISEQGEFLIKSAFNRKPETEFSGNQSETVSDLVSTLVPDLREQLSVKDKQLETAASQFEELNSRLSEVTAALMTAHETARAAQALHAGTLQAQITDGSEPRKGFWSRIFGK